MKREYIKRVKKETLLDYVPPSILVEELFLEEGVAANSVTVSPIEPGVDVEYEWTDGGEIGGDYAW